MTEEYVETVLERVYVNTNQPPIKITYDAKAAQEKHDRLTLQDKSILLKVKEQMLKQEESILLRGNGYVGQI